MKNLIQVERVCMICSINIWLRAVAVHFSTPLRLYQPYACATDTDGEDKSSLIKAEKNHILVVISCKII